MNNTTILFLSPEKSASLARALPVSTYILPRELDETAKKVAKIFASLLLLFTLTIAFTLAADGIYYCFSVRPSPPPPPPPAPSPALLVRFPPPEVVAQPERRFDHGADLFPSGEEPASPSWPAAVDASATDHFSDDEPVTELNRPSKKLPPDGHDSDEEKETENRTPSPRLPPSHPQPPIGGSPLIGGLGGSFVNDGFSLGSRSEAPRRLFHEAQILYFNPERASIGTKEDLYAHQLYALVCFLDSHPNQKFVLDDLDTHTLNVPEADLGFAMQAKLALFALIYPKQDETREAQYTRFLTHLRGALNAPNRNEQNFPQTLEILEALSEHRITGIPQGHFLESYIRSKTERVPLCLQNLREAIENANEALEGIGKPILGSIWTGFNKAKGSFAGFGFDPATSGNVPHVISFETLANGQTIVSTRLGTPTIDALGSATASVSPEYVAFLRRGKQTLYVNHQKSPEMDRAEGARFSAIQALQEQHNNFHFLSLPFDGDLFESKEANPPYFRRVINSLTQGLHGFALPKALLHQVDERKVDGDLVRIWDGVSRIYFEGRQPRIEERELFLMLFYAQVTDYVQVKLNIEVRNRTCKDAKDRGGVSDLIAQLLVAIKTGTEENPAVIRNIFYALLSRFIIKEEAILESRLKHVWPVLDLLARLTPEQKRAIREDETTGCKYVAQHFPAGHFWGASIGDPKKFLAAVERMGKEEYQERFFDLTVLQHGPRFYDRAKKVWHPKAIRHQIEADLGRNFRVYVEEEESPLSFDQLKERLGFSAEIFTHNEMGLDQDAEERMAFLALFQQGSLSPLTNHLSNVFGNEPNLLYVGESRDPKDQTRFVLKKIEGKWSMELEASFELKSADPDSVVPESSQKIDARLVAVQGNPNVETHWQFRAPAAPEAARG